MVNRYSAHERPLADEKKRFVITEEGNPIGEAWSLSDAQKITNALNKLDEPTPKAQGLRVTDPPYNLKTGGLRNG